MLAIFSHVKLIEANVLPVSHACRTLHLEMVLVPFFVFLCLCFWWSAPF
uniref:Uncharacterized protein n=1 Tax=Anguilla anguilla TaxID=7936 RepID=A0A0E9XG42_ANGAN